MKRKIHGAILCFMLGIAMGGTVSAEESAFSLSNAWTRLQEDGKRALIVGRIKAAFADRKDISGRYIRVRHDGKAVQLAGFVPDEETAKKAEAVAKEIAAPAEVVCFWKIDKELRNKPPYKTHVGEQTQDMILKSKILLSLAAPDVTSQLTKAEIIEVDVQQGNVTVYLVADAPLPEGFDLAPHIKPIPGVLMLTVSAVTATIPL